LYYYLKQIGLSAHRTTCRWCGNPRRRVKCE